MKKNYFLGLAANYSKKDILRHTFSIGSQKDYQNLENFLTKKYNGESTYLTKNGRSALALALKANFKKGDGIIVNGFTCYAVYEAIKSAGLTPIFADINLKDLNFDLASIKLDDLRPCATNEERNERSEPRNDGSERASRKSSNFNASIAKGIIVQNTLGDPVDIKKIEKFASEHNLIIIEDLAHCAGVKYPDGREAGTVGAATILSFGKEKSIDTVSGGAVIFRRPLTASIKAPTKSPKLSDHLRARFYPILGATCRSLTRIHLGGILMRTLLKLRFVEKSADNKLDLERKPSKFEAKLALRQLKRLSKTGEKPIRNFCFVNNRSELLAELKKSGFYFDTFWYEKPVSPERYYKKVHFPEDSCKNAVYAAEHIINTPIYYRKKDLEPAKKIIAKYLEKTL